MDRIRLHDKEFVKSIPSDKIQKAVETISQKINTDLAGENPLFIGILNGSFMFTADLLKHINMNCQVSFLKLSSYKGASTTGKINELIGLNEEIAARLLVILEDIVDTGTTLACLTGRLMKHKPKAISIATLLFKPSVFKEDIKLDYVGIEIPDDFVVGYGLDYNELGRNYEAIYKMLK